jgi:hypothetical protein
MVIRRLPAELADVIRRAAHYPHGLGFLHQAWADSVAVTLGVHLFAVDATRAYLETPQGRAELMEAVRREQGHASARPYGAGIVSLPGDVQVTAQIVDCDPGTLAIGDRLRLEFRRVRQDGESGILCYGYKLVPVRH